MIIRVWRGRTRIADADEYERFLREMAYPDYGKVPGNRGWILLRCRVSDTVEFMFVSFWDSMEALAQYTGGDPEQPKSTQRTGPPHGAAGRSGALSGRGPSGALVRPQ